MQVSIVKCDLCGASDLPPGYVVLAVSGDRAASLKALAPGNRGSFDCCDECGESFAAWVKSRSEPPKPAPAPTPTPTPEPPAAHAEHPADAPHA